MGPVLGHRQNVAMNRDVDKIRDIGLQTASLTHCNESDRPILIYS